MSAESLTAEDLSDEESTYGAFGQTAIRQRNGSSSVSPLNPSAVPGSINLGELVT